MSEPKLLYAGGYLNLMERNGWEYVTRNTHDVAIILPVFDNGRILLIKEFRQPLQKYVIGLPAGLVGDKGEEGIFDAARRELLEETGYMADNLELVLSNSPSSSGMTTETFNLLIARKLRKLGAGGGDNTEDIENIEINLDDIDSLRDKWVSEGFVIDPKIYMGLYFIK
jgi:ADP-ribose pyrophosphatase